MLHIHEEDDKLELPPEFRCSVEVVVIGGGLSGLLAARECALHGCSVHLYEAKAALGGRVRTVQLREMFGSSSKLFEFEGYEKDPRLVPKGALDLGMEWIDVENHEFLMREAGRYGLEVEAPAASVCYAFNDGASLGRTAAPIPVPDLSADTAGMDRVDASAHKLKIDVFVDYERCLERLDVDVQNFKDDLMKRRPTRLPGYSVDVFDGIDVSWSDYVSEVLRPAHSEVCGFFLATGFSFMNATTTQFSALQLVELLARLTGKTSSLREVLFRRYGRLTRGAGQLVECVRAECEKLGVKIFLGVSVAAVEALQPPRNEKAPVWRGDLRNPQCVCKVALSDGTALICKAVVVCVAINVLPSISFKPPLADSLQCVSTRCQIAKGIKLFVLASGVSERVDEVYAWPGCVKSTVKYRFRVPDAVATDVVREKKVSTNDHDWHKHRKRNVENFDIYGDDDSSSNASGASVRSEVKVVRRVELSVLEIHGLSQELFSSRMFSYPPDSGNVEALPQAALCTALQQHLLKHHPTIKVLCVSANDFCQDKWARGPNLAIRAGTRAIHADACAAAKSPWGAGVRCLYFAGSDLSDRWVATLEGAVLSAIEKSCLCKNYVRPVAPPSNWVQKKAPDMSLYK